MVEGQDVERLIKGGVVHFLLPFHFPVATDEVGEIGVELSCFNLGAGNALRFGNDALGQRLAHLDAPLVERINLPDHTLGVKTPAHKAC